MTEFVVPPEGKKRATYLPWHKLVQVNTFADYLHDAFPDRLGVYLVGSALRHAEYRDVDVRVIFHDDDFDVIFGPLTKPRYKNAKWNANCVAWTHFGCSITGLLIDCQFDRMTEANAEYPHTPDGYGWRHPLGKRENGGGPA